MNEVSTDDKLIAVISFMMARLVERDIFTMQEARAIFENSDVFAEAFSKAAKEKNNQ